MSSSEPGRCSRDVGAACSTGAETAAAERIVSSAATGAASPMAWRKKADWAVLRAWAAPPAWGGKAGRSDEMADMG